MTRNYTIDFFKCLAIFGVVCIHTHTFRDTAVPFGNGEMWAFIIDTIARFSVPFFFAASGYLFAMKLERTDDTFAYFKRYTGKLIGLLAAWFAFYWIYDFIKMLTASTGTMNEQKAELTTYFQDTLQWRTLLDGISYTQFQLWFMFALIFSIIIIYTAYRLRILKLTLLAGLVLNLIGLLGQSYGPLFHVTMEETTRNGIYFGLFYTALGACFGLYEKQIIEKARAIRTRTVGMIIVAGFALQLLERYILHYGLDLPQGEYLISTIPLTVSLLLFTLKARHIGKHRYVSMVAKNVVGIYLIHTLWRSIFDQALDQSNITQTFAWGLLYAPILYAVSLLSYVGLQYTKGKLSDPTVPRQAKTRTALRPSNSLIK
ncbi:Surface polysaccharide O-acyltransferase, integral membrane enzyme [Terribacillus halophilus]|uniref:Surface polysaccharide O-acyltransferase, integral membrane enzyme n=1 Tax=Terribacillus halophilus TaxID=361279 RepID=A0A1G6IEA4_9BACI|nr:acyltransferase [Terribacillus halophilus]SDC04804.1 Surface polysaccharide O-acyltransferase, integral membrane enzyme [Terribacillus halophilus]